MILLTVRMTLSPDRCEELVQTIHSLYPEGHAIKGLRNHRVFRDHEDENTLRLMQQWDNREELDEHMGTDTYRILMGALDVLTESREMQCETAPGCSVNDDVYSSGQP